MRITLESDYALRILTALAEHPAVTDAATLAQETSVTPRFTLKILHKLAGAGFVRSRKGAGGGYTLQLSPECITLKSVIESIDGPIAISRCLDGESVCALNHDKTSCAYHHIFDHISMEVARKLEGITIADVIHKNYKLQE